VSFLPTLQAMLTRLRCASSLADRMPFSTTTSFLGMAASFWRDGYLSSDARGSKLLWPRQLGDGVLPPDIAFGLLT
jgi:hypothetical protein